jgi:hypothetical protein
MPTDRRRSMKPNDFVPTTVAILGENRVVGRALESLLQSADLGARFFPEYPTDPTGRLGGAGIALLLPASSAKRSTDLVTRIRSHPATAKLPIIELITALGTEQNGHTLVLWPCTVQELKQHIEAVLPRGMAAS